MPNQYIETPASGGQGGSAPANAFSKVIPELGTTPTATIPGDAFTLSGGGDLKISGDSATKTITLTAALKLKTQEFSGFIEIPTNKTYVLCLNIPWVSKVTSFTYQTLSGTATLDLLQNGSGITGFTSLSASNSYTTTLGNATVNIGDVLALAVSGAAVPMDLAFTVIMAIS